MTADLLTLVQWLSPAFPTGGFAYSQGLEWAISEGQVRDATTLQRWLGDGLAQGSARGDAVLLAQALRPGADHEGLNDLARALAPCAERWQETIEQGTALARTVAALTGRTVHPHALPVALGQAAAPLGLPVPQVVALFLHAGISNLVSCAVRFVPLGQTEGQAVLAALHPAILGLAEWAAGAGVEDITSATLGADLAMMRHETLETRIYRT